MMRSTAVVLLMLIVVQAQLRGQPVATRARVRQPVATRAGVRRPVATRARVRRPIAIRARGPTRPLVEISPEFSDPQNEGAEEFMDHFLEEGTSLGLDFLDCEASAINDPIPKEFFCFQVFEGLGMPSVVDVPLINIFTDISNPDDFEVIGQLAFSLGTTIMPCAVDAIIEPSMERACFDLTFPSLTGGRVFLEPVSEFPGLEVNGGADIVDDIFDDEFPGADFPIDTGLPFEGGGVFVPSVVSGQGGPYTIVTSPGFYSHAQFPHAFPPFRGPPMHGLPPLPFAIRAAPLVQPLAGGYGQPQTLVAPLSNYGGYGGVAQPVVAPLSNYGGYEGAQRLVAPLRRSIVAPLNAGYGGGSTAFLGAQQRPFVASLESGYGGVAPITAGYGGGSALVAPLSAYGGSPIAAQRAPFLASLEQGYGGAVAPLEGVGYGGGF